MKYLACSLALCALLGLSSCDKLKEMKTLGDNLKNIADTAQAYEGLDGSAEAFDPALFDMSEKEVRAFYRAVETLMQKHPGVHFEVPYAVVIEAMEAKIDLKKVIEAETSFSFEDFNRAALAILAVRTQGVAGQLAEAVDEGSDELKKIKDNWEMVERVRTEFKLPD